MISKSGQDFMVGSFPFGDDQASNAEVTQGSQWISVIVGWPKNSKQQNKNNNNKKYSRCIFGKEIA